MNPIYLILAFASLLLIAVGLGFIYWPAALVAVGGLVWIELARSDRV